MTQSPKPDPPSKPIQQRQGANQNNSGQPKQISTPANTGEKLSDNIDTRMVNKIDKLTAGLQEYQTRELVEDTEELGKKLARDLKTTQIRKFLDAVNRLKAQQIGSKGFSEEIKSELQLLRPKLAYAAARQKKGVNDLGPVEPLKRVLEAAIKKVEKPEDFARLVQLIESIIASHKAAGGKEQ